VQNFAFKFQAVAEKTAKIVRGLLYFAAPCSTAPFGRGDDMKQTYSA